MTYVLYSLAAVWVVLVLAWALYVAPTGGPLGPLQCGKLGRLVGIEDGGGVGV